MGKTKEVFHREEYPLCTSHKDSHNLAINLINNFDILARIFFCLPDTKSFIQCKTPKSTSKRRTHPDPVNCKMKQFLV
jgi:hypothetical protein